MAYVPSELRLLVGGFMSNLGGPNIWSLQGVVAPADADANNFITDAFVRGMRRGDILFYTQWDNVTTKATLTNVTMHVCAAITSGAGDLSNIASTTMSNSD